MRTSEERAPRRRWLLYGVLWLVAATLAVTLGVVAVSTAGAGVLGRGPLSNEDIRNAELAEGAASPDPDAPVERRVISDEFGSFVVECRGSIASGVEPRPDRDAGWRVISWERGPDDDVDAVFAHRGRSIEIEVFCNQGVPTVAEIERNTLADD